MGENLYFCTLKNSKFKCIKDEYNKAGTNNQKYVACQAV